MLQKREISLLPKEDFEQKPLGRFLIWALSVGRWIVVFTEFIVICAFLSRFYLDRRIADLHEEIFQKQAMVKAASEFEEDFRFLRKRLEIIDQFNSQSALDHAIEAIVAVVPSDVSLMALSLGAEGLEISAATFSSQGLINFWQGLNQLEGLSDVEITEIIKERETEEIQFNIVADFIKGSEEIKNAT